MALGELLNDFVSESTDAGGYPTLIANPGGIPGIPEKNAVLTAMS